MQARPKLVVFDLDGTLVESKQPMSAQMGELVGELLQMMPVAVMSGAAFHQFERQFLPALPEQARFERLYLFPTNAAVCYIHKDGGWQTAYDHSLTIIEKSRILQALKEARAETGLAVVPEYNPKWGEQEEDRGTQITFSALGQRAPVGEKKRWDPTKEKRLPLYKALVRRLPDFSVGLNATTSIDITRKGISKAYGVRRLIEMTDISVSEMLYIGDALKEGGNDAVVKETGIRTQEVFGPEEAAIIIQDLLNRAH
ncbi:HAD-IIB family hydrolase [Patescibacteria group bacterium]|nr:HAD-IIB family hydrolase [Patescibacteria group bacterium]